MTATATFLRQIGSIRKRQMTTLSFSVIARRIVIIVCFTIVLVTDTTLYIKKRVKKFIEEVIKFNRRFNLI